MKLETYMLLINFNNYRMTNKSMRERHWLHMGEIMNFKFDSENENFTLKAVMKAPLTKFKTEIEGVCNGAIKEEIDVSFKIFLSKSKFCLSFSLCFKHLSNKLNFVSLV